MNLKMKEPQKPICQVVDCTNDIWNNYNICMTHYISNNESLKCDTAKCSNKRVALEHRCMICQSKIKSLYFELNKADTYRDKIIKSLYEKFDIDLRYYD